MIQSPGENDELFKYPTHCKDEIVSLQTRFNNLFSRKLQPVMLEARKPKSLRFYEPTLERVFEGKKRRDVSAEQAEHQKLVGKYKREMKGALREIRRDNSFLSNVRLRKQAKSDAERRRKVKEIYNFAAAEKGEYKILKKKNLTMS